MSTVGTRGGNGGRICRKPGRLQMHAPSSIQVGQPSGSFLEWKVAIPLLSPLDMCSFPATVPEEGRETSAESARGGGEIGQWRHPAEPFCYEPIPASAPIFAFPRCL
ncbi:hypothetical protein HPP92_025698 [Vanilla planifolia]|uniref:Uncharacterized protein n=1 Tax=Vanilla planifolia TaxID=51239 RepID=A0A835PMG9_VANPL|nr:hypothetical protein HPP92_025698 [Vanilla planifolia]